MGDVARAALALVLAALLAGCGRSATPAPTLKVYRHAEDGAPSSLEPVQASNTYSAMLLRNVYDTLYSYQLLARPYRLKPNLAEAMPEVSADGLTYTIRLKHGVHFIDDAAFADGQGREVTAPDVVYSLQRHFDPASRSQGAWLWQNRIVGLDAWKQRGARYDEPVAGLRTVDAHTVQVQLLRPYPQFVHTLTMAFAAVVPREAVNRYGREFARHPVGSGPFRLVSLDSARAVLERNPKFRQEPVDLAAEGYDEQRHAAYGFSALNGRSPPFVDRVEIEWIADPSARWASFEKGSEVQATMLPADHFDRVLESRQPVRLKPAYAQKYREYDGVESGLVSLTFNFLDPALGDRGDAASRERNHALRCAITRGFDWQQRNARFYGGTARVFSGMLTPAMPEFDASQPPPHYDPDAARKLLADAGFTPDSLPTIEESAQSAVINRELHDQFAGFMRNLGWPDDKLHLRTYASFGDLDQATKSGKAQIFLLGWELDYPDAENTLQLYYGPNSAPGTNTSNYRNPEFDKLYEQAVSLQPGDERTALFRRMNALLIDDCAGVFALSRARVYLWHRNVTAWPDREIANGFWLRYVSVD